MSWVYAAGSCDCKCHTWKPRKWALCLQCGNWRHPGLHEEPAPQIKGGNDNVFTPVDGNEFVRQLEMAVRWHVVSYPDTGRLALIVKEHGKEDRKFMGPDPATMSDLENQMFVYAVTTFMDAHPRTGMYFLSKEPEPNE